MSEEASGSWYLHGRIRHGVEDEHILVGQGKFHLVVPGTAQFGLFAII
jgi:hypothetical protein